MNTQLQETRKPELRNAEMSASPARRLLIPAADVYETVDAFHLLADMPGVDEKAVDITLEKNILTLRGSACMTAPAGYSLAYGEYEPGDFQRVFTLAEEIDREGIQAAVTHGVLRLTLPKSKFAKSRKITVQAA